MKKLHYRHEVDELLTWDLSSLFKNIESIYTKLESTKTAVYHFVNTYQGKLDTASTIAACLIEYMEIVQAMTSISTYTSLNLSQDQTNNEAAKLSSQMSNELSALIAQIQFVESDLSVASTTTLQKAIDYDPQLNTYLQDIIDASKHQLHPEVETTLQHLSPVINVFYSIYNRAKLADLTFDSIFVNNQEVPLSFTTFENELEYETDHQLRHLAYQQFHKQLSAYQHTLAATYQTQVQKEKTLATLRHYDNVFDYLLFDQKVSKDMMDRQIDILYSELSPIMIKYVKLLQKEHQLDTMTFADLKLPLDPEFEPEISIEQAKDTILKGLHVLGDDYQEMINKAFDERWIDFENNIGKSTGAFCSSPYGYHPFILISWSKRMRECFVLAHEIGHAGHFYNAHQHQNILNSRPSLYFIEAPSTINELLVAQYLKENATDPRMKRWILSTIISRTYYHNFVTHLLEAHYQREVYNLIEQNKPLVAETLNTLTLNTIQGFWKDAVQVDDYAKYTWMRQPHYYMGLYPYTYSAGLTISTLASQKMIEDPNYVKQYLEVLQAGGTLTPLELASKLDIDLTSPQALKDSISLVNDMIEEIITITKEINSSR